MKKMKRFASLTLALILVLALAVPAFAAGDDGTITITNATIGETYSIYKVFDATYSGTDNKNASYTINSVENKAWYDLVNAEGSPFALTQVNGGDTYNVARKDDVTDAQITDWLNGIETLPAATDSKPATETTGATVEFTGVDFGYYLVKSTLNGGGTLTVDNVNPDATVIDKNQEPGKAEKKVTVIDGVTLQDTDDKSAEIDDVMQFVITYGATNYDGDKKIVEYKVKDEMPDGLKLDNNSIQVKVGEATLVKDTDYTVEYDTTDEDDFTVTISWVKDDADKTSKYDSPTTIEVTYNATMLEGAIFDGAGNENKATITHQNDGSDTHEEPDPKKDTDTETVWSYALAIKKVDKQGKNLAGAKFALTDSTGAKVMVTGGNGAYMVDHEGTSNEIVSPENGLIVIKGVKDQEYTLTEIEAPAGYNLLTAPQTIHAHKIGGTTTTITKYLDADGNVLEETTNTEDVKVEFDPEVQAEAMVVVNFTGSVLPSTGGIGTTIFYAVGGILVAGAAILLVARKRVNEQ